MTHIFLKSGFLIVLVKRVHLILFYDRFLLWQNSRVRSRAIHYGPEKQNGASDYSGSLAKI